MFRSKNPFFLCFSDLSPHKATTKSLSVFFFAFFGTLLFAAIASPWVYFFIQWLAKNSSSEFFHYLSKKNLSTIFNRLRWIPLLILLPWMIRYCRLNSLQKLGLSTPKLYLKTTFYAFLAGFFCVTLIATLQQLTAFTPLPYTGTWGNLFLKIVFLLPLSVLVISLIEELLFRAIILRLFYTAFSPLVGLIVMSLFFAYVHFKAPSELFSPSLSVDALSGFPLAFWNIVGVFYNFQWIHFLSLVLLGMITGILFFKTQSLYPSIAFHAGIIFPLFIYKKFFVFTPLTSSFFLGTHRLQDGLLTPILLSIILIFLIKYRLQCPPSSNG